MAEYVKINKVPVNVLAIARENDVDTMNQYHIEHYPTIRLYKGNGGGFVEYNYSEGAGGNLNKDGLLNFLKQNGVEAPALKQVDIGEIE